MAEAARDLPASYWARTSQPATPQPVTPMPQPQATTCKLCGAEFLIGARFCHVCGSERGSLTRPHGLRRVLNWTRLQDILGLSPLSLIAGLLGTACLLAALAVGFLFQASTLVDWQAIQFWRIECTLGAVAFFLLGILGKKSR